MGEEFQNKLIELLTKIETGTPGAFKELVEQKSAYYATLASNSLTVTIIALIMIPLALTLWRFAISKYSNARCGSVEEEFGVMVIVISLIVSLASSIITIVQFGNYLTYSATAAAPLGTVLDSIR